VFYYLTSSLKRRLLLELRDSFSRHPIYNKLVPNIQNKYSFKERPHFGIVLKGVSANKVVFSSDNFIGEVLSRTMLTYVGEPRYPIEWVREDLALIDKTGGMPTAPGVYYLEILKAPTDASEAGLFAIDPLLTVTEEPLIHFQSGIEREAQLQNAPAPGTVRLYENRTILLKEGVDYRVDSNGRVTFLTRFTPNANIQADYRYPAPSIGPVEFFWNRSDFKTLPGVVMAFGKRAKVGDKVAIVVHQDRVPSARAFGGKFEVNFDLDVITTDPIQTEEVTDLVVMHIWGEKKSALEFEGIEVVDISMGGESEEAYDETGDLFFYSASVSIQLRADWEIHIPLPLTISKVTTEKPDGTSGMILEANKLFFATSPFLVGRNNDFERIG
jgi:hypothetical protein